MGRFAALGCVIALLLMAASARSAERDCYPRKGTTVVETGAVHIYERMYRRFDRGPRSVTYACIPASRQRYRLKWGDEWFHDTTPVRLAGRFTVYAAGKALRIRDLVTGDVRTLAQVEDTFHSSISSLAVSRRGATAWLQDNYWAQPSQRDFTRLYRLDDRGLEQLVDCNTRSDTCVDGHTLTMSADERRIYWREFFGDQSPASADVQTAVPAPAPPPTVRADGSGGACRPRGSRILAGSSEATVFRVRGRIYGCSNGGVKALVRTRQNRSLAPRPVLAGHFVAFRKYAAERSTVELRVFDLAAGRLLRKVGRVRADAHHLGPYVLNDIGSVAWATQELGADGTVSIRSSDETGQKLLDRSADATGYLIDPSSLALGDEYGAFGSQVYWYRARGSGEGETQLARISARRWG